MNKPQIFVVYFRLFVAVESASVGTGHYKFENEKKSGSLEFERKEITRPLWLYKHNTAKSPTELVVV